MFAFVLAMFLSSGIAFAEDGITKELAAKELGINRKLSCSLRKGYPTPLFDFRIHSPYQLTVDAGKLKNSKKLFLRIWTLPLKDEGGDPFEPPREIAVTESVSSLSDFSFARNSALDVRGSIALGPGEYVHVLALDDGEGLGCVFDWKVKAKTSTHLRDSLALAPGEVADPRGLSFGRQRRVAKNADALRVAVFLNADSRSWRRALSDNGNMVALAASLRKVAEDPRVGELAVTVFSLEDQRVLYDQEYGPTVNFRRVGGAFRALRPGEVDFSDLEARSEARFLGKVLRERDSRIGSADLLLFVGARSPVTDKLSAADKESVPPRRGGTTGYLVTNPFRWRSSVARDVIGHFVKTLNGKEREIRVPEELAKAVDQLLSEAIKQRDPARDSQE